MLLRAQICWSHEIELTIIVNDDDLGLVRALNKDVASQRSLFV